MAKDEIFGNDCPDIEESAPTKKSIKKDIKKQLKFIKLISDIKEIQKIIDYYEFNKGFSDNIDFMLNMNNYNHNYSYLKNLFKAKLIELYSLVIRNYLEVNKFILSYDVMKKLEKITHNLLSSYNSFSRIRTIRKIRRIIDDSEINRREI